MSRCLVPSVASAGMIDEKTPPDRPIRSPRGFGSAELETGDASKPIIVGRRNGSPYTVTVYDCADSGGECRSLMFYSCWSDARVSLRRITEWNREKRFSRAYIDDEKDPVVEMDLKLFGGITLRAFEEDVVGWRQTVRDFKSFVIEKP